MKKPKGSIELLVSPLHNINLKLLGFKHDTLIVFSKSSHFKYHKVLDHKSILNQLSTLKAEAGIANIAFISKDDHFDCKVLEEEMDHIFKTGLHHHLTLLVPYLPPPPFSQRNDGKVQSALVSLSLLPDNTVLLDKFWKIIYEITYTYLNSSVSQNIEIFQIGKPGAPVGKPVKPLNDLLKRSLLIIPHKGSVKLLKRCLCHLNITTYFPDINLCFDDKSYKKMDNKEFANLKQRLTSFLNIPGNVGPFLPTHQRIMDSNKEFIFFHGSDDISVNTRFIRQLAELNKRKLDMLGSHELRVDQFAKSLIAFRNPRDVTKIDSVKFFYPLTQGTALITKKGYLKAKGFSTNARFGYDSQFLLRSCFILKMGNIDDFLYIRFKRPNSLTTKSATKIGSNIRSFLNWRWTVDYNLVNEDKLNLDESSLAVQKHKFDYELVELPAIYIK